jgi:hypothetical protein
VTTAEIGALKYKAFCPPSRLAGSSQAYEGYLGFWVVVTRLVVTAAFYSVFMSSTPSASAWHEDTKPHDLRQLYSTIFFA